MFSDADFINTLTQAGIIIDFHLQQLYLKKLQFQHAPYRPAAASCR